MGFKGDNQPGHPGRLSNATGFSNHRLMTEVHPVEITDGGGTVPELWRQVFEIMKNSHCQDKCQWRHTGSRRKRINE
jgi:hypothetical protein